MYRIDCSVAEAVAAYLDCEHYAHLHKKYVGSYRVISQFGFQIDIEQSWGLAGLKFGNRCITEYCPPATFVNKCIRPFPNYLPSIHHLIQTRTELHYYLDENQTSTVSHLKVDLEIPFYLWPIRRLLENSIKRLKIEKDMEDIEMIERQQKIFGKGNLKRYTRKDVFMLHKDAFIKSFNL